MIHLPPRGREQQVERGPERSGPSLYPSPSRDPGSNTVATVSDDFENRSPITRSDLVPELKAIGVEAGQVLMLHASLSSLGNVIGGADSVVLAIQEVLGGDGTLIALASWDNAPADDDQGWPGSVREAYLRDPPAFDPLVSAWAP
jgi:hypothetical protein